MSLKLLQNTSKFRKLMLVSEGNRFNSAPSNVDTKVAVRPEKKGIGGFFSSLGDSFKNAYNKAFKKDKPTSIDTRNAPRVSEKQRNAAKSRVAERSSNPSKIGSILKNGLIFLRNNALTAIGAGVGFAAGGLVGAGLGGAILHNMQRPDPNITFPSAGIGAASAGVALGGIALATGAGFAALPVVAGGALVGGLYGAAVGPFIGDAADALSRGFKNPLKKQKDKNVSSNPNNSDQKSTNNSRNNVSFNGRKVASESEQSSDVESRDQMTPQELLKRDGVLITNASQYSNSEVELQIEDKSVSFPQGWQHISYNGEARFAGEAIAIPKLETTLKSLGVDQAKIDDLKTSAQNLYDNEKSENINGVDVVTFKLNLDKLKAFLGTENINVTQTPQTTIDQDPSQATIDVDSTEANDEEQRVSAETAPKAPSKTTEVATKKEMVAQPLTTEYKFQDDKKVYAILGKEVELMTASKAELQDERFANALSAKWGQEKFKDYWNQIGHLRTIFNACYESVNQEALGNTEQAALIKKLSTNLLNGYFDNKGGQKSPDYKALRKAFDSGNFEDIQAQLQVYYNKINSDFKYDEVASEIKTEFEAANQVAPAQNEQQATSPEQNQTETFTLPELDLANNESKVDFALNTSKYLLDNIKKPNQNLQQTLEVTCSQIETSVIHGELELNKGSKFSAEVSNLHGALVGDTTYSNSLNIKDYLQKNPDKNHGLLDMMSDSLYRCLDKKTALTVRNFASKLSEVIAGSYIDSIEQNTVYDVDLLRVRLENYLVPKENIDKVITILDNELKEKTKSTIESLNNNSTPEEDKQKISGEFKDSLTPTLSKIFELIYRNPQPEPQA